MDSFIFIHKIIFYQLYIFQLEEYDISRFIRSMSSIGIMPSKSIRKKVVFTSKALLLLVISIILQIATSLTISILIQNSVITFFVIFALIFYLSFFVSFLFLISAQVLIFPFENFKKNNIIKSAKDKIKELTSEIDRNGERIPPQLRVIGITGSYGKTTMKEVIYQILSKEYAVTKTPGNNNTPLGISKTILQKVNSKTEILILEMGEYVKGDVKKLCEIAPPSISILTGINEAHLERYKTMENAISTKFEIIQYANPYSVVAMNGDDDLILQNYSKYINNNVFTFYSSKTIEEEKKSLFFDINVKESVKDQMLMIKNYKFYEDASGQSFEIFKNEWSLGEIKVPHLGKYIIGNIVCGVTIARMLGMSDQKIRLGVLSIKPIEHRLEPKVLDNGTIIIDDTYNGNTHGIDQGLEVLRKFSSRRKVYVTPGLVEVGDLKKEIHIDIGRKIATSADFVILIANSVTDFLVEGLLEKKFPEERIIIYPTAKIAYAKLKEHIRANDVVLMQNDWSDNYK